MPDSNAAAPKTTYFWHAKAHPADTIANPPRVIARGDGVYVTDGDGRKLIDSAGGLLNVNLGYSAAPIKRAIAEQLEILPFYSSFRGTTNGPAEELARMLIEEWFAPEDMARVFFTSGGSDSVETALRLARQYWKVEGALDRYKYISFKKGYHGTHFGADSVSGGAAARRTYEPLLPGCYHIATPNTYRNVFDEHDPEKLGERVACMLEEEIVFQGPDTVAAFITAPVIGADGIVVPPANFWPRARAICDKYGVLFISDEVVTGFGRTGYECGVRAWGIKPDMMTTAKAITSGYFPLGACLVNSRIAQAFEKTTSPIGQISHGYTYSGHPVGCAAGVACLRMTRELRLWEKAGARGEQLLAGLRQLKQKHALVGDVRGKGLFAGIEIVADRQSKKPVDNRTMERIFDGALAAGVLLRAMENAFILSPPLILDEGHVDQIVAAIDAGLAKV